MANENVSDYDRQYEEDLEKARALSLESLALEQFKNRKRLQDLGASNENNNGGGNNGNGAKTTKAVSRASSMTESDSNRSDRMQVKSRPRPGGVANLQNQSLIAPPPVGLRRNSSVTAPAPPALSVKSNDTNNAPDLISFTSPPANAKLIDFCQQLYNLPNPQQKQIVPHPFTNIQYGSPVNPTGQYQQQPPSIGWNKNTIYNIIPFGNTNVMKTYPMQKTLTQTPPALPPPPLIPTPSTSSQSSYGNGETSIGLQPTGVGGNLIDLTYPSLDDRNSVRVSILEAFDPLTGGSDYSQLYASCASLGGGTVKAASPVCSVDDTLSVCDSIYDEYDPYDFIYSGSGSNSQSDPMYAAVIKSSESEPTSPPPPLPPRANKTAIDGKGKAAYDTTPSSTKLFESIQGIDKRKPAPNSDLQAFHLMVQKLRNEFRYDSPDTNMGLVISPMMDYRYKEGTSIKLSVYPHYTGADQSKAVTFTCDVTSSVQHVTLQLKFDVEAPSSDQYTLKVWGYNEYLAPTTLLSQYEYVHNCIKLEEDVVLILMPDSMVDKSLRRTKQDDNCDREIRVEDIIPNEPNSPISCDNLRILLETFEKEVDKTISTAIDQQSYPLQSQGQSVVQSVKLVVQLMGSLETIEIADAIETFKETCSRSVEQTAVLYGKSFSDVVQMNCEKIRESLRCLIRMYSQAFRVDFGIKECNERDSICYVPDVTDTLLVRLCTVYRPSPGWNFNDYKIAAQVYVGRRAIGNLELTQPCEISRTMCAKVLFNCWLDMQIPINLLARESRLVLVLYGRSLAENQESNDKEPMPQYKQEEIGWASLQLFDYNSILAQGNILLSIWPKESSYINFPAPSPGTYPFSEHPVLEIQITGPVKTIFPAVPIDKETRQRRCDFNSLDLQTQQQLQDVIAQNMLYRIPADVREVLWDKRHYLYNNPKALPKVLLASNSWEWARLSDLHGMLKCWSPMRPVEAFELLLPTFHDMEVRKLAVKWISPISSDELVDYLPQLVVALRHETYEDSALAKFLLERALKSPRVAHHLFWLLAHNLPGANPQNYSFENVESVENIGEIRHHRRMLLMLRALLAICGEALRNCFLSQQLLVRELYETATLVQRVKESQKMGSLNARLKDMHHLLDGQPTSLPLSPTLQVCGINVSSCYYFPSNTLPLKITFTAKDGSAIPAIFKVGDELQQDMLTLQIIRLMDKLWLKEGIDLKMVVYGCVPTGKKRGMIEMVTKAETLRKIHNEHGLTGSFKDKPIAEWLAKHNPSELEYGRAVENFTASCAGYCVATYILGICDRHNDNIMLKTSGHLFHIDFGKFLGDAQMFGNFKRDRTPFVLTSDMAYVINGGDRPSEKFHKFVDLCCQAFNVLRRNENLFLYLFTLMASSGIKGITNEAVSNLHNALLPGKSNPEAAAYFARLIEGSLKNWFTQFNFFLHNLAQLKFSGDHGDGETLSFVPKTYNMEMEGKLTHVQVIGYRKCYDPDKYYVYILRVTRAGQTEPMDLLRTYKEFCELHQKLCLNYPLAQLHSLSNGLHMGRSNVKQVANRRFQDITLFLKSLFSTADEIAHSDLVYTFFHPLLRDQQTPEQFSKKTKGRKTEERNDVGRLKGQLKLSTHFNRGVFSVMVHHARGLPLIGNTQEPSTYVKVYLKPDVTKETKRKTKVVKRNCHPSFMEMLEYRMNLDVIRERVLTATVWNYDALQENEFLGGVELELSKFDLSKEMTEWFPLANVKT